MDPEFCLRGIPPPVVGGATNNKLHTALLNGQNPCPTEKNRNGSAPLLGGAQWKPPALLDDVSGKPESGHDETLTFVSV